MDRHQTSVLHRGNTFFGDVEVVGDGPERAVRLRYNGEERESRLDGLPVAVVAHLLLRELVLQEMESGSARPAASGRPGSASMDRS